MWGNLLTITWIIVLLVWLVFNYSITSFSSLSHQKNSQIESILLKNKLLWTSEDYSSIIQWYKTRWYWFFQVKSYDDLLYHFVDRKDNWDYWRWIVFEEWTIWENKRIEDPLTEWNFEKIYLVSIQDKKVTIIKIL